MRPSWRLVGVLLVSSLLTGCGESGESTATPDNLQAAADAAKKMQLREAAANAAKKKQDPSPPAKAPAGAADSTK